jgi:WD40 repeat protein
MFSQFYEQTKNNNKKQKIEKEAIISDVQPTIINRLDQIIHIGNICSGTVYSPIELKDKRIAIGGGDGSLLVFSLDYTNRKWVKDIFKEKVHSNEIQSICEINGNKLVSCSTDYTIKIWNISQKDLSCIKTLTSHTDNVYKVIPLTQNRFASCSGDKSIKIWNSQEPYQEIVNLVNENNVYSMIRLNKKNEIVASCSGNIIVFWNLNSNTKTYTFKGYYASYANHMIEIPNDKIAISPRDSSTSIIIIDSINYNVVKEIKLENFITGRSSLYQWNNESFIYIYNKCLVQISTKDFEILFKTQNMSQLGGIGGILTTEDGKYIITNSNDNGLEIIEPK